MVSKVWQWDRYRVPRKVFLVLRTTDFVVVVVVVVMTSLMYIAKTD